MAQIGAKYLLWGWEYKPLAVLGLVKVIGSELVPNYVGEQDDEGAVRDGQD